MLLLLLATAITAQPARRCSSCRCSAAARSPAGSFGTGALAAFVATPCAGPFLGAALGTALLLPLAGRSRCSPRSGLAWRFRSCWSPSFPALRSGCRKPGPWMARLQRFLAIPMAATRRRRACGCSSGRRATRRCSSGWPRRRRCCSACCCGRAGCSGAGEPVGLGRAARGSSAGRCRRRWCRAAAARRSQRRRRRRAVERGARSPSVVAAGQAGVRLFHRRLVPDLQGQ